MVRGIIAGKSKSRENIKNQMSIFCSDQIPSLYTIGRISFNGVLFMVILNIDGSIRNTTIIKYREEYGGEVGNKRWLAQYNHYNPDSTFKVGQDIDAITGATISAHSISKGIYKITLLYPIIKEQLQ